MRMRTPTLCALLSLLVACSASGPGSEGGPADEEESYDFVAPKLDSLTPESAALGDTVLIFGSDFLPPEHGTMRLELEGTYTDQVGESHPYKGAVALDYMNPGLAELHFDKLWFSPSEDRIGRFRGTARLVSRFESSDDVGGNSEELASETIDMMLRVEPSIVVEKMRPVNEPACAEVTTGTHPEKKLELVVRAIGLGSASPEAPWTATLSFQAPQLKVQYVREADYQLWPPSETTLANQDVAVFPDPGTNVMTFAVEQGSALFLDPSRRQTTAWINPPVSIGQQIHDRITLARFSTGSLEQLGTRAVPMIFEFHRPDGTSVRRVIDYRVFSEVEIANYDGTSELIRRYDPQQTCGCFSGGDIGRDLTYREGESQSKTRSLGFRRDVSVELGLDITVNFGLINDFIARYHGNASVAWTQSFGINVEETVTSEMHKSLDLSARILPSYYGTCYRQTEQLEREVDVVYHNACGVSGVVGQAVLTDWTWGFDIATGQNCPPATNLPPSWP